MIRQLIRRNLTPSATPPRPARRERDSGAVLLIVLMVMLAMLGLGMTALFLTSGNLQVSANINLRTQALYVAEAGIERARAVLNSPPPAPVLNTLLAGSNGSLDNVPTGVDSAGNPNGIGALVKDGAVTLRNVSFPPASFNRSAGTVDRPTTTTMGQYTVWIRNDLAEVRQGLYTTDANETVVIRSQGIANDGRTTVVLEVTMIPARLAPSTNTAGVATGCFFGKNACDDNSSTQYNVTFAGP
jgi:Tfp pilus assembly protein PilX